jgi:hypothetical protein
VLNGFGKVRVVGAAIEKIGLPVLLLAVIVAWLSGYLPFVPLERQKQILANQEAILRMIGELKDLHSRCPK